MHEEELLKLVIAEKDKLKQKYNHKINAIKQHYGIEFDVNYFTNEQIKSIKFNNLKYKNGFDNLSVIYDGTNRKVSYIDYDYSDTRLIKTYNHRRIIPDLEKEFKLKLVVAEVERVNSEYLKEIHEIDQKYQATKEELQNPEKVLQMNKNEEDE